jgi:hypothetical protein
MQTRQCTPRRWFASIGRFDTTDQARWFGRSDRVSLVRRIRCLDSWGGFRGSTGGFLGSWRQHFRFDTRTPRFRFLGTLPPVCGAEVDEDEEAWDTERFARERRPIPTIQRRSTTLLRKAIERLPYGSSEQNQAADGFWDRYMAWMDRNDSIEGYRRFSATQYFRKVTLTDVWYMAHQRWLYRRDLAEDVAKESAQPKLNAYRIRWRRTPRARRVVEWIGFGESVEEFRKESETDIRQDNPQAVILSCEPTDDPRNS